MHLDGPDCQETVAWAKSADALVFACGVDRKSSSDLLAVSRANPGVVRAFVGVHPSEAGKSEGLTWIRDAALEADGIGEAGLDPTYSPAGEGSAQMRVFREQVELARSIGKPIQVHSRGAEKECLEVLAASSPPKVLMHWLENEEALQTAVERGYYVSFGPALLYSKKLQRMALRAGPGQVLLESDSPVAYSPLGGVRGPMLIPSVAFKLAELRREGFADTLCSSRDNSARFLGLEKG